MFFNADEDDGDFVATGGQSKLANLFGMDKATGQGGNESLTYTAPKEPRKKVQETAAPQGGAPAVVVACVVQTFKYVDNKYASQGKLGIALLANHTTKDYRILLYVNKQQQVTNAKITQSFSYNIQENNYASFYDDARQTWSVMFDSAENSHKFAKEIGLAKANAAPDISQMSEVVKQDLVLGEGGQLDSGDSVEVRYTGWLLTNSVLGQVFDTNASSDKLFRLKLGKGKVIKGWEQGMLGMKKGNKRLLVIPPALAYGAKGMPSRIPPNATLVFEVEAVRVKLAKGDSSSQESSDVTPAATPDLSATTAPASIPVADDPNATGVKSRSQSINEQLSQSPDSNKAKLISRMAKMGQPMLPFQGAVAAQPDDEQFDQMEQHTEAGGHQQADNKPTLPSKPAGLQQQQPVLVQQQQQPVLVQQQQQPEMVTAAPQQTVTMMAVNPVTGQPQLVQQTLQQQPMPQQQQQQQPAFLQNLPGAQQLSVYQNPNNFLLQQQQQQQQLLQQQQQQQQQAFNAQLPGQLPGYAGVGTPQPPYMQPQQQQQQPQQQPQPASSSADPLAPVLLTESRQNNTELRLSISKMADRVDRILDKVEQMNPMLMNMSSGMAGGGAMAPYGSAMTSAPNMEANVLMQNVSRIVQENDRLKKELFEQSGKVQDLNERITDLLQKNQKYVEQSQSLLEQRNEGYKSTASQAQNRLLSLEQEKVDLATQLSTSSSLISTLQLDIAEYKKNEGELKQKLQNVTSNSAEFKDEYDRLKLQREEDEQKINTLSNVLREEKTARKQTESKLTAHIEEFAEMKASNETFQRNLLDLKKKAADERRKQEEDLEDTKINYESTIEGLRQKLRKQKTSNDLEAENRISQLEEEISQGLQQKHERALTSLQDKHNRQLEEVREEKEEMAAKITELEKKLMSLKSSGTSTDQELTQLREELESMQNWKAKYDNLRSQAATMKERYEKRIEEVSEEKEEEEDKRKEVEEKMREQRRQLQQQIHELKSQQTTTVSAVQRNNSADGGSGPDVATEVKKVMNSVFQQLRGEFEPEENYQGTEIVSTILSVVKQTTLKLTTNAAPPQQEESEEEEEEEEEDEEEEEEVEKPAEKEAVKEVKQEVAKEETTHVSVSVPDNSSSAPVAESEIEKVDATPVKSAVVEDISQESVDSTEKTPEKAEEEEESDELSFSSPPTSPIREEKDKSSQDLESSSAQSSSSPTHHEEGGEQNEPQSIQHDDDSDTSSLSPPPSPSSSSPQPPQSPTKQKAAAGDILGDIDSFTSATSTASNIPTRREKKKEEEEGEEEGNEVTIGEDEVDTKSGNHDESQNDSTITAINGKDEAAIEEKSEDTKESEEMLVDNKDVAEEEKEEERAPTPPTPKVNKPPPKTPSAATSSSLQDLDDILGNFDSKPPAAKDELSEKASNDSSEVQQPVTPKEEEKKEEKEDEDDEFFTPMKEGKTVKEEVSNHVDEKEKSAETKDTNEADKKKSEEKEEGNKKKKEEATKKTEPDANSREPPPLFDDDDDDDSFLFSSNTRASPAFTSKARSQSTISNSSNKGKSTPAKKVDLNAEEDLKPQPPPPLFGDESDDDDLDWLS